MKIPFSVYDFFGYLASGLLICACADLVFDGDWLLRDSLPVAHGAFWVTAAYIVGHINAHLASWLLGNKLVGDRLGRPNLVLFEKGNSAEWLKRLFPGYFTPLDENIRSRILERSKEAGVPYTGECLFHHARTEAKSHAETWAKMESFLHLYGFCRNVSFALFLVAICVAVAGCWKPAECLPVAGAAFAGSFGMLYRYLKFYRQYSYEAFTAYASIPCDSK